MATILDPGQPAPGGAEILPVMTVHIDDPAFCRIQAAAGGAIEDDAARCSNVSCAIDFNDKMPAAAIFSVSVHSSNPLVSTCP